MALPFWFDGVVYCLFLLEVSTTWLPPALMFGLAARYAGLTLLLWPFDFSRAPVCHPSKGPNCVTRPNRHLPVWNQRKSSACCLLAKGRKSGKSQFLFISIISYRWKHIALLVCSSYYLLFIYWYQHSVLCFLPPWLYAQLPCAHDLFLKRTHTHTHSTSNCAICRQYLYCRHTDTPLFSGAAKRQRACQSANRFSVTLNW